MDYRVSEIGRGGPKTAALLVSKRASHGACGGELWSILPGRPPLCRHHHSSTGNPEVQVELRPWPAWKALIFSRKLMKNLGGYSFGLMGCHVMGT